MSPSESIRFREPYKVPFPIFIFPPANATYGATYNVLQALAALGSGGWAGKGYGHGSQTQLRFMKVRHTDFIFSAMAAEFGFVGTIIVVGLLIFVVLRCLRAARLAAASATGNRSA